MMSKKVLPVLLVLLVGGLLWAFTSSGKTPDDDLKVKQQQLLVLVGSILEKNHYDPKKIDDSFSKIIFKNYLTDLDPDKNLFMQSDINALKKYENTIDDEIHGASLQFYPAAIVVYKQRLDETEGIYKELLSKPFNFNTDEKVQLDADKLSYPTDAAARKEQWRKRLKYLTLERFVDLQNQRSKAGDKDSIKTKTDAQLEAEARSKVQQIMARIYERQTKTFSEEDQFSLFVNTITDEMDPHTSYLAPVAKRSFDEDMSGRFYGIGALLKEEDGQIKISSVVPGSPAFKTGKVQENDVIMKVAQGDEEPVDITGYATTDAVKLIRGGKNTTVKLTLKKADGTLQVVPIVRDEIVLDDTFAKSLLINKDGKKIGYIYLPEFYLDVNRDNGARCSQDVAKEVMKLKAEGVDGIVMDLRSNPGGSLPEVVNMAGLFIKQGPIVQAKDKNGAPYIWRDNDPSVLYDGPLTVMVNEGSASASEIFAAAMQDYHRAIVVGSTSTYGKGTVQKPVPLGRPNFMTGTGEDGALVLTFEKFYRVNGGSTQVKGVTPDIVLPDQYEYLKIRERDNESALPWDQIQKTDYQPWTGAVDFKQVEDNAK
ncbi:MAG: carboxy terminal-processing peptidase, partial [Williamsia sp.]|nr:carboxy terminal-processing peptidase [Williamsia sp.]